MSNGTSLPNSEELFKIIFGNIGNLPTPLVMAFPFVTGIILGYFVRRLVKIVLIFSVVAVLASYFGVINLGGAAQEMKGLVAKYGPEVLGFVTLMIGTLPLSVGFTLGFVVGFLLS